MGRVVGKILDEFVPWEAHEGMRVEVGGAGLGMILCEVGVVAGVFEQDLPQWFRYGK